MTLTPAFAPDAKSQWRELDSELQELVLDEMDDVALNPPSIREGILYRDVVRETASEKHYLFMRFMVSNTSVTLIGVFHLVVQKT